MSSPILPGATLGVLGGGQLGRMFAIAARDTICGTSCSLSPAVGTDINSRVSDPPVSTVPYNVLIRSASAMHAERPRARSIVMCCPPTANPEACTKRPPE